MNKLFSILFVMTVCCYGADSSVNDQATFSTDCSVQIMGINTLDFDLVKQGSCAIYLDATGASEEEKEAAYRVVEKALADFEGSVPASIVINVGISKLELIDSAADDFAQADQADTDHVIAVKDIKILEVIVDIVCDQATNEEKCAFFDTISVVLVDLCSQLQTVASGIHGSVTFNSPDLQPEAKSAEIVDEIEVTSAQAEVLDADDKGFMSDVIHTVIHEVTHVIAPHADPAIEHVVDEVADHAVAEIVEHITHHHNHAA